MDIKLFPEIGGEDGIWIEYQGEGELIKLMEKGVRLEPPPVIPSWTEIWGFVKRRISADWSTFKKWAGEKWSTIWHT